LSRFNIALQLLATGWPAEALSNVDCLREIHFCVLSSMREAQAHYRWTPYSILKIASAGSFSPLFSRWEDERALNLLRGYKLTFLLTTKCVNATTFASSLFEGRLRRHPEGGARCGVPRWRLV